MNDPMDELGGLELLPAKRRVKRAAARLHRNNTRNNRRPKAGGPSKESKLMLGVLNLLAMQGKYRLFEGVPAKVKAKRRAANKVARQSRRVNRGH